MIYFIFRQKADYISSIIVKGHSLHSAYNTDIVCASVSTAIIVTLNAIEILGLHKKVSYVLKSGFLSLKVLFLDAVVDKLLRNLKYSLQDLNHTYPLFVKEKRN